MALKPVTDPELLKQLGSPTGHLTPVSDPDLLKQLNEEPEDIGALKSGALGVMSGVPGAEAAISAGESALTPKTYEEAHKELEDLKNQAWDTHPVAYGTGKGAGFVGTALAAPVTETLGGAAAVGAGIGALSGVDASTKPSDIPLDTLKGAGTGAVTGGLLHGAGDVASSLLPKVAKGAVASLGKPTLEDVQSYLDNPEAIRNALTTPQIGEKLANITGDVGKASSQLSGEARGLLNPANSVDVKDLKDVAMDAVSKYYTEGNPATAADETAIKTIVDQYQKLAQIAESNNGKIPEDVLRSMIDRLQAATKDSTFGNPEASASQTALKEFSGKLNDLLRGENLEYAEAMKPSADLASLSSDVKSKFSLDPGATDTTNQKMGNILNQNKTESQDLLGQLKDTTGIDFLDLARKAKTKENFEGDQGGSQGMNIMAHAAGYGLGALSNLPGGRLVGSLIGGAAGHNINGGQVAKSILDTYMNGAESYSNSAMKPLVSKFGPILVNAAKQGGNELAATHFVLATSNPEYQTLVDHMQNQTDESNTNTGIVNQE